MRNNKLWEGKNPSGVKLLGLPGSGRSRGEENGSPLQYSCLENLNGQRSLAGCSPWGHKDWLGHN